MHMSTSALQFDCAGETLTGIAHIPADAGRVGVVVVVGGPQYRVGSHRQFLLLSRHLAERGIASLRFDCRGMGDSGGRFPGFEHIAPDIGAAITALLTAAPTLDKVVLWGLCDAASAVLCYAHTDPRVAGIVVLNPWVRSTETLARTYLRHYYLQRLVSGDFWRKLLSGRFRPVAAAADLGAQLRHGTGSTGPAVGFVERMRLGFAAFRRPVQIVVSGNDLTAAEFLAVAAQPAWQELRRRPDVVELTIPDANHTFSSAAWRDAVAQATAAFVQLCANRQQPAGAAAP